MSDTPRTDVEEQKAARPTEYFVTASFARELERALAAKNERIEVLEEALQQVIDRLGPYSDTALMAARALRGGGK